MKAKNLKNLVEKHLNFLEQEHGFKHDSLELSYSKDNLKIEVQHMGGELNVLFHSQEEKKSLLGLLSELLNEEFFYPEHFSSWVISMGDVDSRLAYDAKLIKKYFKELFIN